MLKLAGSVITECTELVLKMLVWGDLFNSAEEVCLFKA
jgi:hypothetical protein